MTENPIPIQVLPSTPKRRKARYSATLLFVGGTVLSLLGEKIDKINGLIAVIWPAYTAYAPKVTAGMSLLTILIASIGGGWLVAQRKMETGDDVTREVDKSPETGDK
jgi:uncharacterized membrane protein YqjE